MSLLTKVGSFTANLGATHQSITGVGFQPKVILFWANKQTADGGSTNSSSNVFMVETVLGMCDGTTNVCVADGDDYTTGDSNVDASHCIRLGHGSSSPDTSAVLFSFDSDGFTLDYDAASSAYVINFLALGGTDLSAKIISHAMPTATGNQSLTGAGFLPAAAVLLGGLPTFSSGWNNAHATAGIGFATGTAARAATSSTYVDTSDSGTAIGYTASDGAAVYSRNDKCYVEMAGTGATFKRYEADLVSFDSDGLTINYTTAVGATATISNLYVLCLAGVQFMAGTILQKTSTGNQATTGVGFQPQALLFESGQVNRSTTGNGSNDTHAEIAWMTGATDGTNQGVVASYSGGNSAVAAMTRTHVIDLLSDLSTSSFGTCLVGEAVISTLDSDGFTLNWGTTDGGTREIMYLAIGPAGGGPASPPAAAIDQHPHAVFGPF